MDELAAQPRAARRRARALPRSRARGQALGARPLSTGTTVCPTQAVLPRVTERQLRARSARGPLLSLPPHHVLRRQPQKRARRRIFTVLRIAARQLIERCSTITEFEDCHFAD